MLVAARSEAERGRIILNFEYLDKQAQEARVSLDCLERLAPLARVPRVAYASQNERGEYNLISYDPEKVAP